MSFSCGFRLSEALRARKDEEARAVQANVTHRAGIARLRGDLADKCTEQDAELRAVKKEIERYRKRVQSLLDLVAELQRGGGKEKRWGGQGERDGFTRLERDTTTVALRSREREEKDNEGSMSRRRPHGTRQADDGKRWGGGSGSESEGRAIKRTRQEGNKEERSRDDKTRSTDGARSSRGLKDGTIDDIIPLDGAVMLPPLTHRENDTT